LSSLPQIDFFYIDRMWFKSVSAIHYYMRWNDEYLKSYYIAKANGTFDDWSDNAWTEYRTLDCIRRAYIRGYELDKITLDVCKEVRKRGKNVYYDFVYNGDGFDIMIGNRVYHYRLDQIQSLRFAVFRYIENERVIEEKNIYIQYEPWLRIGIRPYSSGIKGHMIRVFYNPLLRAKYDLGIKTDGYVYEHDNFVDPYAMDSELFARFLELNHRYAFDFEFIEKFIRDRWLEWFGARNIELVIKLSQLELCFDTRIPKLDLVTASSFVSGRAKTLKYSVDSSDQFYYWTESGLKYYITTKKKGLQVKIYTKAYNENVILNRVEFTIPIKEFLDTVNYYSVFRRNDLAKVYNTLKVALMNNNEIHNVIEILKPLVHCSERCEEHYEFLLEMLVSGEMRGSRRFNPIARIYKELGLIIIEGRGRYSIYRFNPYKLDMINVIKSRIESIIGKFINIEEILKAITPSPQKQKSKKQNKP